MKLAEVLINRKLLLIGNFVLTSGKISPYYLDLKKLPSYPEFYEVIAEAVEKVKNLDFDIIVGVATGGVPIASFIACNLRKPVGYVRLDKKGYGTNVSLEAEVKDKKVLLVDDVATTGSSLEYSIYEIAKEGGKVTATLVIIDRQEGAKKRIEKLGINFISLYTISDILDFVINNNMIKKEDVKAIQEYLVNNLEK
ncbi:MAG: orotate phosphoribosyltransferase [Sulfolobaceae archaeon]|nr:orotate phosphoribosyltransferase [Sulfolobaceae archaeon]